MNRQEVFDKVVAHLTSQGEPCIGSDGFKKYAHNGRYSAIGCHLMRYEPGYISQLEGKYPEDIPLNAHYRDMLLALENVHDYHPVDQWNGQFHAIAKEFGLDYKGVHYGEVGTVQHSTMKEFTYCLPFTVRIPSGQEVTDDLMEQAILLACKGEGRPVISKQVEYKSARLVEKMFYALTIDTRLPNNHSLVSRVGTLAYDQYDAVSMLRAQLGHPDESDLSIIKVEVVPSTEFQALQRIDV